MRLARSIMRVLALNLAAHLKDAARATIGDARALWDDVNDLYDQHGRRRP